jgi:AcrR family transcriptional regulator
MPPTNRRFEVMILVAQVASMEMEERSRRIVETAVELAEQGGFEAVRLRDVAAHAGVALGTLYRRFSSKEDLLVAALDRETRDLERRVIKRPPRGDTELERVVGLFSVATRGLLRRPNLARALLRAAACGEPGLAGRVGAFHERVERMIVFCLRSDNSALVEGSEIVVSPTAEESQLAYALNMIWFALLVGWSGGLHSEDVLTEKMGASAQLVLLGVAESGKP